MNEKLVLQDLVDALSQKSSISKKDADFFFRELFQLILERIFEDDIVKIKDFGTFKLTAISSRESIDVNTGEKIEIPAHQRLTFLPDKTLKNLVNKPFSHFETILLDDSTNLDLAEEEDIEDELDENKSNEFEGSNLQKEDINNQQNKSNNKLSNQPKDTTPDISPYPKSFVYTYTTNTTKNDSIVVSVPKGDLQLSRGTIEDKVSYNKIPSNKIVIEQNSTKLGKNKNDINESSNRLIDIKPKPSTNRYTDTIKQISDNKNDFLDFDSEIETVETVVFSPPEIISSNISSKTIELNDQAHIGDNVKKKTLDRPLAPLDEELENENLLENNFHESIISHDSIENDEKENDDTSFFNDSYNYNNEPTFNSKLKKYLPIALVLIVALVFSIYKFVKLFDVKYEYEDFLGQKNLTLADTLPLVDEAPLIGLDIDSVSSSVIESNESASDIPLESKLPSYIETEIEDTSKITTAIKQGTDTVSKIEIQKSDRIISPLLDIGVVNKGTFYLSKYFQTSNKNNQKENPDALSLTNTQRTIDNAESSEYVTMPKGTTLRSLATKYYGNPAYWVYIYQANRAKLSNPNDIAMGMKILIPKLSDYGIKDPKNPEEIQAAKTLESQLIKS